MLKRFIHLTSEEEVGATQNYLTENVDFLWRFSVEILFYFYTLTLNFPFLLSITFKFALPSSFPEQVHNCFVHLSY